MFSIYAWPICFYVLISMVHSEMAVVCWGNILETNAIEWFNPNMCFNDKIHSVWLLAGYMLTGFKVVAEYFSQGNTPVCHLIFFNFIFFKLKFESFNGLNLRSAYVLLTSKVQWTKEIYNHNTFTFSKIVYFSTYFNWVHTK